MGDEMAIQESYRIVEFSAENFKRLRLVHFKPKGRVTKITGKNDQGKTSALDAVPYALGGAKWSPEMPLRRGAEKLEVKLDLGTLVVTRTASGLKVEMAKGCTAWATPQKMLDSILEELSFNPQAFAEMAAEEQAEALRAVVNLDFTALEKANADDYKTRAAANAEAKRLAAEAASIPVQEGLPKERLDVDAITAEITAVGERNKNLAARITEKMRLAGALNDAEAGAARHEQLIREKEEFLGTAEKQHPASIALLKTAQELQTALQPLIARANDIGAPRLAQALEQAETRANEYCVAASKAGAELVGRIMDARKVLEAAQNLQREVQTAVATARVAWEKAPQGELEDTGDLLAKLSHGQLVNREIDKRERREALEAARDAQQVESQRLTRAMEDREEEKRAAIAGAKMPLEGLTFTASQVLHHGIPIKQLGEAKQILLGVSIAIARNPKLRLVLIPRGEALDDDTWAQLEAMAEEKDFYVWAAKVDSSGKVGIYLEDGMIRENNEQ
jgi:hypothetical protein